MLSIFLRRRLLIVRFGRIDLHYSPAVIAYIIHKNFVQACRDGPFIIYPAAYTPRLFLFLYPISHLSFFLFFLLFFSLYLMQLITKDRANEPLHDCFSVCRCVRRTPGEKPSSGTKEQTSNICIHASTDATAQNLAEKGRMGLAAVYLCTTHRARESRCTRLYNRTVIRPFGKQSVARWPTCWIATRVVCDSPLLRPVYISIHRSFHSPLFGLVIHPISVLQI